MHGANTRESLKAVLWAKSELRSFAETGFDGYGSSSLRGFQSCPSSIARRSFPVIAFWRRLLHRPTRVLQGHAQTMDPAAYLLSLDFLAVGPIPW